MAAKRKPARKSAKTKKACERAGGKPVHFKGMKKDEVICFPKTSKKKSGAKKGKRKQTAKQRAASMRNLKKARAARRK